MKHRIKRANTAHPAIEPFGILPPAHIDLLLEYYDELVWHFKNGRK
jgi:hypothetical protein